MCVLQMVRQKHKIQSPRAREGRHSEYQILFCTHCQRGKYVLCPSQLNFTEAWWHIYASVPWLTIVPDNGCAITLTNGDKSTTGLLGTNVSEIRNKMLWISVNKMHSMSSAKCRPFCSGLSVLTHSIWLEFISKPYWKKPISANLHFLTWLPIVWVSLNRYQITK